MNEQYTVLSVDYADDGACVCENCGRPIKNVTQLQNSKGRKYWVGMDCADTLAVGEISNYWQYQDQKKKHNNLLSNLAKVAKVAKTGKFSIIFNLSMGLYVYDRITTQWSTNYVTTNRVTYKPIEFINLIIKKYGEIIQVIPNPESQDGV